MDEQLVKGFESVVRGLEARKGKWSEGEARMVLQAYHAMQTERVADALEDIRDGLAMLATSMGGAIGAGAKVGQPVGG